MRLIDYFVREGFIGTVRRCVNRISAKLGSPSSITTFLIFDRSAFTVDCPQNIEIRMLSKDNLDAFDVFNFYPHISGRDYLGREDRGIVVGLMGEEMIGYVCFETGGLKHVFGLCDFKLEQNEAWIGPCYVDRNFRGKGINGALISRAILFSNAVRCFTAINAMNKASLASFKKVGFVPFANYFAHSNVLKSISTESSSALEKKAFFYGGRP